MTCNEMVAFEGRLLKLCEDTIGTDGALGFMEVNAFNLQSYLEEAQELRKELAKSLKEMLTSGLGQVGVAQTLDGLARDRERAEMKARAVLAKVGVRT